MAEDAIELGFEAFDKVTDRYHNSIYDSTSKLGNRWRGERADGQVVEQNKDGVVRPVGPKRRSSSLPPEHVRQDSFNLNSAEEGYAGDNRMARRDRGLGASNGSNASRRRDRVYVDEHGQDYVVPASRYQYDDERYRSDQPDRDGRGRRNNSARPPRDRSRQSSSRHGLIPEDKKSKVHHIAAAVAGGVAGGFVGQTAGKGDLTVALAGAVIGALGAGFADRQLEKKSKTYDAEARVGRENRRRRDERGMTND